MKRVCWSIGIGGVLGAAIFLIPHSAGAAPVTSAVFGTNVAYLHIADIDKDLAGAIPAALNHLEATNAVAGVVVDVRFAGGNDLNDLPEIEEQLEHVKLPLAILMNSQTTGAPAKLAEDLREENLGLVFGTATGNFQPDISVPANLEDQRKYLDNPYAVLPNSAYAADASTNLLPYVDIDHTTEADLVREKIKDGDQDDTTDQPAAPQKPFIHDPVLARGVDFIKGVAALRLTENQR